MEGFTPGLIHEIRCALAHTEKEVVPQDARIRVHAAVSRFAFLYERIRNAVDYKDEHVLRKSAILRIFKRQMVLEKDPRAIAEQLIRELIGARYLPNGELNEVLFEVVAGIVKKYLAVRSCHVGTNEHFDWFEAVLAVEIEEALVDASREKALVNFLYERLADRMQVRGYDISTSDLRLQVYITCYRMLHKADNDLLAFKLLRAYVPEWLRPDEWQDRPTAMAERLVGVEQRIKRALSHPLALRLQRAIKPWSVSLGLMRDALLEPRANKEALLADPAALRSSVAKIAERRYTDARGRLRRGAFRATIYLFATKMIIALVLEVPIEHFWYGEVSRVSLAINLLFPPALMVLVASFIRLPGKDNTTLIQENVGALLTEDAIPMREMRVPIKKTPMGVLAFRVGYALMFAFTFGLLYLILSALHFTWVSQAIFFFFLCLVSFFAFRLRHGAQEYVIVEDKPKLITMLIDFVSLPILQAGQWLSGTISRLNVFLFLFDFIIEAPYKIFLRVLEEWFGFMKEKKEELQ